MVIKYKIDVQESVIIKNIEKLTNKIYKMLPMREENLNWESVLDELFVEISVLNNLLPEYNEIFFQLIYRLTSLKKSTDFSLFRKNIFKCLNLMKRLKERVSCKYAE